MTNATHLWGLKKSQEVIEKVFKIVSLRDQEDLFKNAVGGGGVLCFS